jgi:hypothetical protein
MDNEHRSLILTNAKNCMIASKSEMHQGIILQEPDGASTWRRELRGYFCIHTGPRKA